MNKTIYMNDQDNKKLMQISVERDKSQSAIISDLINQEYDRMALNRALSKNQKEE